jgi:hypothetical protein
MIDLYNNKYDRETLKNNIYALNLIDIVKTQHLDYTFVSRYILNKKYQFSNDEKNINIYFVLEWQPHLHIDVLLKELNDYDNDDDSVTDFQTFSEKF